MKVDFSRQFVGPNGSFLKENIAETVVSYMFNLSRLGDKPATREQKMMAYRIYSKITKEPSSVEITTEEASFIKEVCSESLTAGAYGQIEDIIENN